MSSIQYVPFYLDLIPRKGQKHTKLVFYITIGPKNMFIYVHEYSS